MSTAIDARRFANELFHFGPRTEIATGIATGTGTAELGPKDVSEGTTTALGFDVLMRTFSGVVMQ